VNCPTTSLVISSVEVVAQAAVFTEMANSIKKIGLARAEAEQSLQDLAATFACQRQPPPRS
jgi:hypothetical protein